MKFNLKTVMLVMSILLITMFATSAFAETLHGGGGRNFGDSSFNVGDIVHLVGTYTTTSEGTGEQFSGLYDDYIIAKIQHGAPNPYGLKPLDKDWIDGWASDDAILHNYTDVIFNEYLSALQIDSSFIYFGDSAQFVDAVISYFELFNHGAKYDVKRAECWNALFSVPFPGVGVEFWFNGYVMTPEILGNYLYGLTGKYWGFGSTIIHQGAGYAQRGTEYLDRPDLYYGDNEDDYYWIQEALGSNYDAKYDIDLSEIPASSFIFHAAEELLD